MKSHHYGFIAGGVIIVGFFAYELLKKKKNPAQVLTGVGTTLNTKIVPPITSAINTITNVLLAPFKGSIVTSPTGSTPVATINQSQPDLALSNISTANPVSGATLQL